MGIDRLAELLEISNLTVYLNRVEQTLEEMLVTDNSSLREPSIRLIKSGGKRIRPFFVIAASKSLGKEVNDRVIRACAAIELVHIGTIVHDDIIDNANVRWGVPTINKKEGVNHAILVGDYLLALAASQATMINSEVGFAIANTIAVMCDGQSQETADEYNIGRTIDSYSSVIQKKTATLTSTACRVGGLCVGLSNSQTETLAKYGESFGMAFQLIDDLLDLLSTSEAMGKPVGNDIKEGIYTYPVLFALKSKKGDKFRSWLGKDVASPPKNLEIIELLDDVGAIEATITEIRRYNDIATHTIKKLGDNKVIEGLSKLPSIYLDWALKEKTDIQISKKYATVTV